MAALITISSGRSQAAPDLVDLLLACHERIRRFVGAARQVGEQLAAPHDQIVEVCRQVERYVTESLPLHVADEEQSILPRLCGRAADVDRALATMADQHARHELPLAALVRAVAAVGQSPDDKRLREPLAAAARDLEREFAEHLALEESIIFPAIRRLLAADVQAQIAAELRHRRALEHDPTR
jgi:iron-sulfur cluster repair protein YtfE (RIC family)